MEKTRKIGLWIAGVIIGLLVLLVASSLLVPLLVDQQTIRAKLQERLGRSTEGAIDFETVEISLLPPRGKLTNISLAVPGRETVGVAESATAYLKILPLFRGRIQIGSVEVRRPDFRVEVPEFKAEHGKEKMRGLSLENLAGGAYGALARIQAMQPELEILIREGRLSLTRGGEPVVVIRDLDGQIDLPPDELSLDLRSASNAWESFRLAAKVNQNLEGKGRIEVKHLQPHLLTSLVLPKSKAGFGDSQIDAQVNFEMKGYRHIEGDVEASAPRLTIRRGESASLLKVDSLKGKFRVAEREVQFALDELAMASPGMRLSGQLYYDETAPTASAELFGQEVNVGGLRDLSLSLAGDLPIVKKAFETALGGTIDQVVFLSKGKSWKDLFEPMNMDIKATVSQARVHIPDTGLNLDGGTGRLFLSEGLFKGEDLTAHRGNTQAKNGDLVMGIQGENPSFHLAMDVRADLAQGVPLLTATIDEETFRQEMERIKRLKGTAQGRIVLGDRLKSIRPRIEVNEMNLNGEYERLPFPVEVSRGRVTYEGNQISWKDLAGRMGKSQVARTEGKIDWGDSPSLLAAGDRAVVDLGEIHPWLSAMGELPAELKELKSVKGQVTLSAFQLKGPLKDPKALALEGEGEMENVIVESPRLPGPVQVGKAGFSGNSERIEVQQAAVFLSDADLSLSGQIEGLMQGSAQLTMNFQGNMGPAAKKWISGILELPPEIRVRAPLNFSKASLVWGKGKETSFTGDFNVGNGPQVSLDVAQGPQGGNILIRNLAIDGPDGRAALSMNLGEKVIDLQFQGALSEATVKQIMEGNAFTGWIRGDFTTRLLKDRPAQSTLQGSIEAGDVSLPAEQLNVHSIALNGYGNSARIDSASFGWKGTEVFIKGTDLNFRAKGMDLSIAEGRLCEISTEAKGDGPKSTPSCALDVKQVSGQLDLSAEGAEGFLKSLQGKFAIKAGEGRIYRFGLLAKILAVINITEILKGEAPDLTGKGFGYHSANFEGTVEKGVIDFKEGAIDGHSMGLAFEGSVNLPAETLDTTVLVAPLKTVDSILNHIPIISGILGKDFVAIPVGVKGHWSDPTIIPLSPSAVGSKLLGVVERTLKLPFKLFQPLFGKKGKNE